jgi:hypothetical protein
MDCGEDGAVSEWRINGTIADSGDGSVSDTVAVAEDRLFVHGLGACGENNVDVDVVIPKDVLLRLLRNAGWIPHETYVCGTCGSEDPNHEH